MKVKKLFIFIFFFVCFIPFNVYASNTIEFTDFNIIVGNKLPLVENNNTNYIVEQHWYENNNEITNSNKIENNKTYTYKLTIKPIEGYTLEEDTNIEINNVNWINTSVINNNDGTITFMGVYRTDNIVKNNESNSSIKTPPISNIKNGWYEDNGNLYYYINGELQKGFKTIGEDTYFFSYADGRLKHGWQSINGIEWFYCKENGTIYKNEKITIDSNTYYFDESGYRYSGFKTIGEDTYFFSYANGKTKTGFQTINGINWFYCKEDGIITKGLVEIDGEKYYFNKDTGLSSEGLKDYEDKKIYTENNGKLITGFQTIAEDVYFFSYANGITKTGFQTLNGSDWFYCREDGTVAVGFELINNDLYYFSVVNYMMKKGFQSINGIEWFYCQDNGIILKGLVEINGSLYYFNEQTGLSNEGLKDYEDKKIYTECTGKLIHGFKKVNGVVYFFSYANGRSKTDWQSINGIEWFYCNEDGTVAVGFKTINNELYYFSASNYYLKHGWQTIDGKDYFYCDENGVVLTGRQTIMLRDYNIGTDGFVLGFSEQNGRRYYRDVDGTVVKGMQKMCGRYFYFDEDTGAFIGYGTIHQVIDVSKHQGYINWNAVIGTGTVDAVIVRAGYASDGVDIQFVNNINALNSLGVPYSVYLFSYAETRDEALAEADFLISLIRNNNVRLDSRIPIYYDLEDWEWINHSHNSYGISKETYHEIITAFINKVESALGHTTRVYASKSYITDRFLPEDAGYVTWVAQWPHKGQNYYTDIDQCTYSGFYQGWQYSDASIIAGYTVDRSLFYMS